MIFVEDEGLATDPETKELTRRAMNATTKHTVTTARAAVDAASLVFAQSIVEDYAWSFCRVCSPAKPEDWDPLIKAKQVDFATLSGKSFEEVRQVLIAKKLAELERESLLDKVDLLLNLCPRPKDFSPIVNYAFNRDRLKRIDGDRHRIIHRNGLGGSLPNIEQGLAFLFMTAKYLMHLVMKR